jgi:uncharacterized DUF497 family protein
MSRYHNAPLLTWDEAKRAKNLEKHGIDFSEAEAFDWDRAVSFADDRFEYGEVREVAYGFIRDRLHVLVFTSREEDVHVISLRKANEREKRRYDDTFEEEG